MVWMSISVAMSFVYEPLFARTTRGTVFHGCLRSALYRVVADSCRALYRVVLLSCRGQETAGS